MKRGFTLVELLIVLGIIGLLLAFYIEKIRSTPVETYKNSMKNDIHNAALEESHISFLEESFDTFFLTSYTQTDLIIGSSGGHYPLSKFNSMQIDSVTCSDGSDGFKIKVFSEKVPNFYMFLNSCNNSKIQKITL